MTGNRTPVEDRRRLIEAHQRGDDFIALALQLGVNRTTAYSIVRLHQEYHRVEPLVVVAVPISSIMKPSI